MSAQSVGNIIGSEELKSLFSINTISKNEVMLARKNIEDILAGRSNRKILIIGPCSADFESSLTEYAEFLHEIRSRVKDKIEIIMRFYTGKPRSIGGWKGMQHAQPGQEANMNEGLKESRRLAIQLLKLGIPLADEMLHPQLSQHFDDIFSYLAVGARSTENQYHREVTSGLDIPVGMKNPTSGNIAIMTDSIKAAQTPSHYSIGGYLFNSTGNSYAHGILRGGSDGPNYSAKNLREYIEKMKGIENPALIVDCNHANSGKNPFKQIEVINELYGNILPSFDAGEINVQNLVKGFMVESYLFDGRQDWSENVQKGLSLTDACIGKEKTEELIMKLYENIK
ncbi:3-deoxy-7-phosphoheptulonate synthase [Candidatus Gracilibacteria bacterium CG1_02_38_174]|nr:MAG: 3-deoxy-7-phosphoheptulonate synthase [Candidatus Gracilibacteria bacterium CG1_02_38_174]